LHSEFSRELWSSWQGSSDEKEIGLPRVVLTIIFHDYNRFYASANPAKAMNVDLHAMKQATQAE